MRHLVTKSVSRVVIGLDYVKILIDRQKLLAEICHVLNLPMAQMAESDTATITIPVEAMKPKTGFFVVKPKIRNNLHDPFDHTPQELKDWVRGVIWRKEHFKGSNIRQIAKDHDCSISLVSQTIAASFSAA